MDSLEHRGEAGVQPFDEWFRISDADSRGQPFFAEHDWRKAEGWRMLEHDWLDAAGRLALQLDSDTNNTSLVLAFELARSGRVLLFPGDAQVGSWLSWEGLEWEVKENGESRTVTARDLMVPVNPGHPSGNGRSSSPGLMCNRTG
jgi:hypothetical protein